MQARSSGRRGRMALAEERQDRHHASVHLGLLREAGAEASGQDHDFQPQQSPCVRQGNTLGMLPEFKYSSVELKAAKPEHLETPDRP